jgi:hypothetical protein
MHSKCRTAIMLLLLAACANEPQVRKEPTRPTKKPEGKADVQTIHPQPGQTDCVEMYGTCTPPPDRICTSTAFVLSCNETGQRPNTNTWLKCICH